VRSTVNDKTKRVSALAVTSLVIALFAGLFLAAGKIHGDFNRDDIEPAVVAIATLLLTSIGILVGLIALYKRRKQIGLTGLLGLLLNALIAAISIYMILASFLREFTKALGNAR
jgi:Kef-type K+ transport system membrane component KefB